MPGGLFAKGTNVYQGSQVIVSDAILVQAWSSDAFHRRVLVLEAQGYSTRLETYRITPETNPDTGEVTHMYIIEMIHPDLAQK